MIVFIIEDENPFGVKLTTTALHSLNNIKIIPIQEDVYTTVHSHLLHDHEEFFLVLRAGDTIRIPQLKQLLARIERSEVGIAHEEEKQGILPIVWRTDAVLEILKLKGKYAFFSGYFFHQLYYFLKRDWKWKKVDLTEFFVSQLKEPKWKHYQKQWELLFPILSAEVSHNATSGDPMVSIVLCTYNEAFYLYFAIYSVLVQSNPNWELIVVNDGSTDDTNEILTLFEQDSRIIVIDNDENMGKAMCLNMALSFAKAPWLLELDSDDWLSPDCIDQFTLIISKHASKVLIYANYYEWIQRYNQRLVFSKKRECPSILTTEGLLDNPVPIAPRVYNKSFLKAVGGWCTQDPYGGRLYEDLYMLNRCISHSTFHIPLPLYHRRVRSNSITQREQDKFMGWKEWFIRTSPL